MEPSGLQRRNEYEFQRDVPVYYGVAAHLGCPSAFSQAYVRPIPISEILGDTLDPLERDIYGLLPDIEHFLWPCSH